jgi:hypothetical protein
MNDYRLILLKLMSRFKARLQPGVAFLAPA